MLQVDYSWLKYTMSIIGIKFPIGQYENGRKTGTTESSAWTMVDIYRTKTLIPLYFNFALSKIRNVIIKMLFFFHINIMFPYILIQRNALYFFYIK